MRGFKYLNSLFNYLGILSYIYLAYTYFHLWIRPSPADTNLIATYSLLIIAEFFLIHSGTFMLVFSKNKFAFLFLFLFYGFFVLGYNAIAPDNTVAYTYLFVIFNRMKWILYSTSENMKSSILGYSFLTAFVYLVLIMSIVFLMGEKIIPRFGLNETYFSTVKYTGISNPHVNLSFGAIYFTVLSLLELLFIFYKKRPYKSKNSIEIDRDTQCNCSPY